jgi:hypothetical protein
MEENLDAGPSIFPYFLLMVSLIHCWAPKNKLPIILFEMFPAVQLSVSCL